jgi:hypothetical protein
MFCHITQNWRGRPLVSHEVIVNLIAAVTTRTGLKNESQISLRRLSILRSVAQENGSRGLNHLERVGAIDHIEMSF